MPVTQYIGARYVPIFLGAWDATLQYEPLSVVLYEGNSYTSRQTVPIGILPTNDEYWALTGNYNAQIELYRQETQRIANELYEKAPIKHSSEETIYGIGNETNYGHIKLSDDENIISNANQGIAATPTLVKNITKKVVYKLEDYKNENEDDYTNAFSRIMNEIEDGGCATILGNGVYNGILEINKPNVFLIGGIYTDGIIINVPATANNNPSNISIKNCFFNTQDKNGITLTSGTGIKITSCEFTQTINASGIYANTEPTTTQQLKQTIISDCRFFGGYSVYINSTNLTYNNNFKYLSADTTITNCEMVNLLGNVYMTSADGFVISNNTMFLSLGDSNKLDNIYADMFSMAVITNNQLFEAGRCGVYLGKGQNGNVSTNNIVWPNQYVQLAGIYIGSGTVSDVNNLGFINVSNNIIDRPVGDGIYIGKEAIVCNSNSVAYSGSTDHWKNTEQPPQTTTYVINAPKNNINSLMNSNFGSARYNFNDSKNANNNITKLNFGNSNYYDATYTYFGFSKPIDVSNEDPVVYDSQTPFIVVINKTSIPESVLLQNATAHPKLGCITAYQQNCAIGSHTLTINKPELFILYSNKINWLK